MIDHGLLMNQIKFLFQLHAFFLLSLFTKDFLKNKSVIQIQKEECECEDKEKHANAKRDRISNFA